MNKAADNFRFVFLMAATLGIMSLGAVQLMKIQLVDGSSYLEKSRSSGIATQVISAPRGEITDADGEYLVSNKSGFNAVIEKAFFPSDDKSVNRIILTVAEVLGEENVEWEDILPITSDAPFEYEADREGDVARLRKTSACRYMALPRNVWKPWRPFTALTKATPTGKKDDRRDTLHHGDA